MISKNFLSMGLVTPKSLSIVVSQFQELLSNKIATSQETELINSEGKIIDVELSSFFLVKKDTTLLPSMESIKDKITTITDRSTAHSICDFVINLWNYTRIKYARL